jgi:hypothetical protein
VNCAWMYSSARGVACGLLLTFASKSRDEFRWGAGSDTLSKAMRALKIVFRTSPYIFRTMLCKDFFVRIEELESSSNGMSELPKPRKFRPCSRVFVTRGLDPTNKAHAPSSPMDLETSSIQPRASGPCVLLNEQQIVRLEANLLRTSLSS